MHRNDQDIGASIINDSPQKSSLEGCVAAETAEIRDTKMAKGSPLPCPHHQPNLHPTLLEVSTAQSMGFDQPKTARNDARVQPIQRDRLKNNTERPMHMGT